MNTDTLNIGVISINKFIFYSLNYKTEVFKVEDENRYLPDFFKAFEGEVIFGHLADKFVEVANSTDGYGRVIKFYTELDSEHRSKMLAYIMENYNDEQRIRVF